MAFLASGAAASTLAAPAFAAAQVLQIEPDGAVTTFSGPSVFTAQGVVPLKSERRPASLRRAARPAAPEDYRRAAAAASLSIDLIAAVAWRESRRQADAVSPRGARGEMQLMPATARSLGVDPSDGAENVRGGAAYLSALLRRYDGDLIRALAAYNAGPAAVDRYGGVPPYPETRNYVAAVLDRLSQTVVPSPMTTAVRR